MSSTPPIALLTYLVPCNDGALRTTNPFGDFVASPRLTIDQNAFANALGSLLNLQTGGTAINFNLSGAWITGVDAGVATFALSTTSGNNVQSCNWGISSSHLTQSLVAPGSVGSGIMQISAFDTLGNKFSMGQFQWAIVTPPTGAINWTPGHYIMLGSVGSMGGSTINAALTRMNAIVALDTTNCIKGFEIQPYLSRLVDPNNPNNFDGKWDSTGYSGFAGMDQLVNRAQSFTPPRTMTITIYASTPSGNIAKFPSSIAPAFLNSSTYGTIGSAGGGGWNYGGAFTQNTWTVANVVHGSNNSIVRFWNQAVANVIQNVIFNYIQRYGSKIYRVDPFAEISPDTLWGYTDQTLINTLKVMGPALRAQCPKTLLMIRPTYIVNTAMYPYISDALKSSFWSFGDYDGIPEPPNLGKYVGGDVAYRGIQIVYGSPITINTNPVNTGIAFANSVGKGDFWVCPNEDELGPANNAMTLPAQEGSGNLTQIMQHAIQQGASHMQWGDNTYTGPNSNRTSTSPAGVHPNLIDFLANNAVPNITYPVGWPT